MGLLPTFYPSEAEKKGVTPSQYGFVFGVVNLAAFLFAPFFARYGTKIGPRFLVILGAFIQAFSGLSFGFLAYVETSGLFLGLSYFLRFVTLYFLKPHNRNFLFKLDFWMVPAMLHLLHVDFQ